MSAQIKYAIIGAGIMGEAIVAGLLRTGLALPENIRFYEPRRERCVELQDKYHILPAESNREAVNDVDVVLLSVKPQVMDRVLSDLRNQIPAGALVMSIVAGASIETISAGLKHSSIIRCMPNTPAQIGEGITVWTASKDVKPEQLELGKSILCAFGQEVFVDDEHYLDMATALSGSGPAYIFLFLEAMIDAGVHLGFSRHIAQKLVIQTMRGSVNYFESKKEHPAHLRNEVTSPGGTSAAALYYLEKAGIRTAISRAIWAAYERSQELGRGKKVQIPDKNNPE